MLPDLPPDLRAAINRRLDRVSRTALAIDADRLSDSYRRGKSSAVGIPGADAALAYLVARMPATYAAFAAALAAVSARMPDFAPSGLLDLGAGPGTATFAAVEAFATIESCTLLEPHAAFRDLAAGLMAESADPTLKQAKIHAGDARKAPRGLSRADLVIASYVLVETDAAGTRDIVTTALAHGTGTILLVEPGTPAGFDKIRAARVDLIAAGLHIVAPCPGNVACPMTAPDWCHFSQRLPRSRDHMVLKAASVPFEDERYAYVAASRTAPAGAAVGRVLAEPETTKAAVGLKVCTLAGLVHRRVPRSDKAGYKAARKYSWGDAVPLTTPGEDNGNDP